MWCRPGAQDREVIGHVLAGRDPSLVRFGPPASGEASGRDHGRTLRAGYARTEHRRLTKARASICQNR
jgi:hypothetical protein